MKKFVLISALFFLFQSILLAQNNFPKSWVGSYRGQLHLYTIDSIAMRVDMKLDIAQTMNDSIFQWKMTYIFNGNEDVRDYQLKLVDASKGHYMVDENNSILIDAYYRNGILTSFFEVEKSFIISEYKKVGAEIHFDIISAKNSPNLSGNQQVNGETIPEVLSFPVNGRQEAVLIKI